MEPDLPRAAMKPSPRSTASSTPPSELNTESYPSAPRRPRSPKTATARATRELTQTEKQRCHADESHERPQALTGAERQGPLIAPAPRHRHPPLPPNRRRRCRPQRWHTAVAELVACRMTTHDGRRYPRRKRDGATDEAPLTGQSRPTARRHLAIQRSADSAAIKTASPPHDAAKNRGPSQLSPNRGIQLSLP